MLAEPGVPDQADASAVVESHEPVIEAANTIKRYGKDVLQYIDSRITTRNVEGLSSKINKAMKRAYGFKSFEHLRTVTCLAA